MPANRFRISRLLPSALLCLALAGPALPEDEGVELPEKTVTGKKQETHFQKYRNRSRAVLNFRPKVKRRKANVAVTFVSEATVPGAQIWMYPAGSGYPQPAMTDAQAKEGRFALEVVLKADAYAGGAVCSPSPLDLSPWLETGMLEFWVKGDQGKEVFSVGLLDNGNNPIGRPLQVWVSSRSYARTGRDEWRRIRVPMKAFGARGSYWSEEVNARIFSVLNWKAISCFSFDIDKERHKSFKIWMDDVVVYKVAPKDSAQKGEPYAISNEDFEDFPATP